VGRMDRYQLCALSNKRRKHLIKGRKRSERYGAYKYTTECGQTFIALDPKEPNPKWPFCKNCAGTKRGKAFLRRREGKV